jgi:predicted component of type VI protein secretion system
VLRHLALLQPGPRSASALQRMLAQELHPARARVRQHVRSVLAIPEAQRHALGLRQHQLGLQCRLGRVVDADASTILIDVCELAAPAFLQLLPAGSGRQRLGSLLQLYLREPLRVLLRLQLRADAGCPGLRLGAAGWARVGLDAWLGHAGEGVRSELRVHQEAA